MSKQSERRQEGEERRPRGSMAPFLLWSLCFIHSLFHAAVRRAEEEHVEDPEAGESGGGVCARGERREYAA